MWPKTVCKVVIIDGQGGRIGRELVEAVDKNEDRVEVIAIGTNSTATANMLKGGAHQAATGENAVLVACRTADIIAGPIGMLAADALLSDNARPERFCCQSTAASWSWPVVPKKIPAN